MTIRAVWQGLSLKTPFVVSLIVVARGPCKMNRAMWDIHKWSKQELGTEVGAFASPGWVSQEVGDDHSNAPRKRGYLKMANFLTVEDSLPLAAGTFNLSQLSVLNADAGGFYEGS